VTCDQTATTSFLSSLSTDIIFTTCTLKGKHGCAERLNIEKDIVQVLQTHRLTILTYFGHVNCMQLEQYPYVLLHGYTHGHRPKGRSKKSGSTTSVKTVPTWTIHYMRFLDSLRTGRHGGTPFSIWTANARCHRHRRNGNKSSQVTLRVVLSSVVSACDFVCLSLCQHDNS